MASILLTLMLSLQLIGTPQMDRKGFPTEPYDSRILPPRVQKLWWGMLDPELSAWFARIPDEAAEADLPLHWNWSWRSFLAALFDQPLLKEASPDARSL